MAGSEGFAVLDRNLRSRRSHGLEKRSWARQNDFEISANTIFHRTT